MSVGAVIRVSKEFRFEAAHFLPGYDGLCANIHGHSYVLRVTARGKVQEGGAKAGMVMDFVELRGIVDDEVVRLLDHSLMVRSDQHDVLEALEGRYKVVRFAFQPTCENLLLWMADKLRCRLPAHVELVSLRLNETSVNYAEWFAVDQE